MQFLLKSISIKAPLKTSVLTLSISESRETKKDHKTNGRIKRPLK